ncbi:16695_t:CDS:2, partial [Acaulospora morrowiae]
MKKCWDSDPLKRPTIEEIKENLDPEELREAQKKREEMIKSGIQFVEKPGLKHPKSFSYSRKLDSVIESSKITLYNSSEYNFSNASENSLTKHEAEENDDCQETID